MGELYDMDIKGRPLAYTPFCDNNKDMDGYRFWRQVNIKKISFFLWFSFALNSHWISSWSCLPLFCDDIFANFFCLLIFFFLNRVSGKNIYVGNHTILGRWKISVVLSIIYWAY